MTTQMILIIAGFVVLISILLIVWLAMRRKKAVVKKAATEYNAMVISPNTLKGVYFTHLSQFPEGSQEYFIENHGKWMYLLIERELGKYERYEPSDVLQQLPSELEDAVNGDPLRAWWAMSKNPLEKLAIGALIAVIGIGAILMFAMTSDKNKDEQVTPQTYQAGVMTNDAGN